jgi:predicted nucleic-acid-binding protein
VRAIDTNVLVRLLTRDDPVQVKQAETFVSKGAWVSTLVLAETVWVLQSAYGLGSEQIATVLGMLLDHVHLVLQDADAVEKALAGFRANPKPSFTDYLILETASRAGHSPLGTFDKALGKITGAEALRP